ncbi:MAG: RDD family protein [Novosphingobium sp.]
MSAASTTCRKEDDRLRRMVTPEGIALPLVLASRGARFGALFIDLLMVGVLMVVTTLGLIAVAGGTAALEGEAAGSDAGGHALQFLAILWIAAMFLFRNAWFLFFELGPRGATPGKRLAGIRIAARDGGRLSPEMVIARNLLRDIELFLPITFLLAARDGGDTEAAGLAALAWFLVFALFPLFNRDRLRAGDVIAGTWVVEAPRRKLGNVLTSAAPASGPDLRFEEAELAVYGEYELQMLERVLRENRREAMIAVYQTICGKIGRAPAEGGERLFLEAYYTQLRARLEAGMRLGRRKADKFD